MTSQINPEHIRENYFFWNVTQRYQVVYFSLFFFQFSNLWTYPLCNLLVFLWNVIKKAFRPPFQALQTLLLLPISILQLLLLRERGGGWGREKKSDPTFQKPRFAFSREEGKDWGGEGREKEKSLSFAHFTLPSHREEKKNIRKKQVTNHPFRSARTSCLH